MPSFTRCDNIHRKLRDEDLKLVEGRPHTLCIKMHYAKILGVFFQSLRGLRVEEILTSSFSSSIVSSRYWVLANGRTEIKHLGHVHAVPAYLAFNSVHFGCCWPKHASHMILFWFFLMVLSHLSHLRLVGTRCELPVIFCLLLVLVFSEARLFGPGFCAMSPDCNKIWKDAVEFE